MRRVAWGASKPRYLALKNIETDVLQIYRIAEVLPRAFVADSVPDQTTTAVRSRLAIRSGLQNRLSMTTETAAALPAAGPGRVAATHEIRDEHEVEMDMLQSGFLAVNAIWTPWWQAEVNGRSAHDPYGDRGSPWRPNYFTRPSSPTFAVRAFSLTSERAPL